MGRFAYSEAGMAMTKEFEGLRMEAYQDSGGTWTIGYGHVGADVRAGMVIDEAEAEALLRRDLEAAVECVNDRVKPAVTQGQFDAMVDFCFNAGRGNFAGSTLLRMVNAGDMGGAAMQFGLWVHAGGVVTPGLVRRRKAEAAMFSGGAVLERAGGTWGAAHPDFSIRLDAGAGGLRSEDPCASKMVGQPFTCLPRRCSN